MYSKNRVGQVRFENFDFLVKVKSPLSQSIFSFFFFFCEAVRTGSDFRVGLGRIRTNGSAVVEDDVIHDVTVLRTRVARVACMACVTRVARVSFGGPNRRVGLKAALPNLLAARGCACLDFWA